MKQDSKNSNKKIIVSSVYCFVICIMLVISIVMLATGSIAWFAKNDRVNSNGTSISVDNETDIEIKSLRLLKYDTETKQSMIYTDDISSHMTLNRYDTVFKDRQEYTAIILEVTLINTGGNGFNIEIGCTGDKLDSEKLATNISNIVKFKYTTESLAHLDSQPNLYESVKHYFDTNVDDSNAKTFVQYQVQMNEVTHKEEVNLGDKSNISIAIEGTGNDEVKLYIMIDYDVRLMNKYVEDNFGSGSVSAEFLDKGNEISFSTDIQSITFSSNS